MEQTEFSKGFCWGMVAGFVVVLLWGVFLSLSGAV